jgi:hypothetical protein
MSNFMKIRPVGAELFHTDRRTDMTKRIAAFYSFFRTRLDMTVNTVLIKIVVESIYTWRNICNVVIHVFLLSFYSVRIKISPRANRYREKQHIPASETRHS